MTPYEACLHTVTRLIRDGDGLGVDPAKNAVAGLLSTLADQPTAQIASLKALSRDIWSLTGWSRHSVDVASAVLSHVDRWTDA